MAVVHAGDRISVDDGGVVRDGIVFDVPSRAKVVVAVFDARRGPVLRTVHPDGVSERAEDGARDHEIRLLIRRTPPPVRGGEGIGAGAGQRRAGHTRAAIHRTTGK
jgi:hypothetical protein